VKLGAASHERSILQSHDASNVRDSRISDANKPRTLLSATEVSARAENPESSERLDDSPRKRCFLLLINGVYRANLISRVLSSSSADMTFLLVRAVPTRLR